MPTDPLPHPSTLASVRPATAQQRIASLFPDGDRPAPSRWRRRRRLLAVVVVLALIASVLVATGAFGSSEPGFRTATVTPRAVVSTVVGVATIEPVSQAAVAFPAGGTVASVDVTVGAAVVAGQPLASLDPTSLTTALHTKEAALAAAQLNLAKAMAGQSTGAVGASGSSGFGSSGSGSSGSASSGGDSTGATARLTAAVLPAGTVTGAAFGAPAGGLAGDQQAVLRAQHQVDLAIAAADAALANASTVCAAAGVPIPTSTTTSTTSTTTTTTGPPPDLADCQQALAAVQAAQATVREAQRGLATASNALDASLVQRAAAGSASGTGASSGSSSAARSGSSTTASGPSAADLAADQQAVDAAGAAVAVAQQALSQGTIVSPIAGTVEAVNLTVGATVSSGSTSENVVVTGPGGFEATTTIGVANIPKVRVGQDAQVFPDGSEHALAAKVVSVSAAPVSTTSTTTNYLVVVALSDPNVPLNNGSNGTVAIVTKRTAPTLAVPTSAVTTTGVTHTVQVLDGSSAKIVTVRIGAMGPTWTQITHGLTADQRVVLADLGAPLPGSATSSSNGSTTTNPFAAFVRGGGLARLGRGAGAGGGTGVGGAGGFGGNRG